MCAALMMPAQHLMATADPTPAPAMTPAQKAKAQKAKAKQKADNKKYARNKLDLYQIHNFIMWGGAGYSGVLNKTDYSKFVGGGGGLLGLGYEWHYKKFQLSLGPEFRFFSSQDNLFPALQNGYDLTVNGTGLVTGDPLSYSRTMVKTYNFRNMKETQLVGQAMLPIMVGAQFDKVPIYFMLGAKIGYTVMANWSQKADLTTTVKEKIAMDEWKDVPFHGMITDGAYSMKGQSDRVLRGAIDAVVTAEVGVQLDDFLSAEWNANNDARKYPWHMRVGLFLDYGLPIISNDNPAAPMITATEKEATSQSLHQSEFQQSKLNSLLVGAKFTALLQLNRPKKMKPQLPYLVVQLLDYYTGKPLNNAGVRMEVKNTRTGKVLKKGPNQRGLAVQRLSPDEYAVFVEKAGYLSHDTLYVTLVEGENNNLKQRLDTTYFRLIPEPVFTCTVVDEKTGEKIPARLEFFRDDVNKVETTLTQDPAGDGVSTKLTVGKNYMVSISAENYIAQMFTIGYQGNESMSATYALTPMEHGKTYIIENLFFVFAKTELLPESDGALTEMFDFLNDNPSVRIRITGHTDSIGKDKDNQILSEGRANAVRQAMIDRGIDPDRIEAEGKGESEPIDTNDTEEGRQKNRRVEFTIL